MSPESITVSPESVTVRVGETVNLSYRVLPEGASQDVTFTVTDPSIVSVTSVPGGGAS